MLPDATSGVEAPLYLDSNSSQSRLLVFNCHEPWVYQLHALGFALDIVVGLRGRSVKGWDTNLRPQPPNSRLLSLSDALGHKGNYACIIAHNLTDLLECKRLNAPKILVIHSTLAGIAAEQQTRTSLDDIRKTIAEYVRIANIHVLPVSSLKGKSWGFDCEAVPFCADPAAYLSYSGDLASGLRVANQVSSKRKFLHWSFHEAAFRDLPVHLVGRNDDMEGVRPSQNWDELKEIFRHHRFYIHTADPQLEDGYNMATLEAMAAGLPVLGNCHPSSPVINGVNGFLSDDPAELHNHAVRLLEDRDLAIKMGRAAQATVREQFPPVRFAAGMVAAIRAAQLLWSKRQLSRS